MRTAEVSVGQLGAVGTGWGQWGIRGQCGQPGARGLGLVETAQGQWGMAVVGGVSLRWMGPVGSGVVR